MTWQEHIKPALERVGTHAIEDVEKQIDDGEAMLWLGENSAAVTEILRYPRAKVFHVWLAGGDMDEITNQMLPKAEAFARVEGCTKMTMGGRNGWNRVMVKHGFTPLASVCAKELL